MTKQMISYYGRVLLIAAEVFLISFLNYAAGNFLPVEVAKYISLDVLYCLPVIQTAHLTAIHASRRSDTQMSTVIGIAVALIWSATEMVISSWYLPLNVFALNLFTRSVVFTVIGRVVIKLWREREYGRKDMLTGLSNRMDLMERLESEQGRSARSGRPYSLLFIDIDQFKSLNDRHGHQAGDEALKILAEILVNSSRRVDLAARFGGDEFVLLLPDTDAQSCNILIKRIEASAQRAFEERAWAISVSIGQTTNTGKTPDADSVIHLADQSMYEAKKTKQ